MNCRPIKGRMSCQMLRSPAKQILLLPEEMGQGPLIDLQSTKMLCRYLVLPFRRIAYISRY